MPKPKYTSASATKRFASSLPSGGPSPSELVGACTTAISQSEGVSCCRRSSPSGVSAQFREVAARSSTSRRRSVNVDAVHVVAFEQRSSRDFELPGGTRQLHLEGAVLRMIKNALLVDSDAVRMQ